MVGLFQTHGAVAFAILATGIAALVAAFLALAWSKRPYGAKIGVLALGLVAVTGTLTAGTVMRSRITTDHAAQTLDEPEKTLYVQKGYDASANLAKLGVALGAVALVAAIIGTLRGLTARAPSPSEAGPTSEVHPSSEQGDGEPRNGDASDSMLGLGALVVGGIALFAVAAAFMPIVMKAPGLDLEADDPARKFRDAEAHLSEGRVQEGCAALEEAFAQRADPKKAKVRSVEGLVTECFDTRLERALAASSPEEFDQVVSELENTKMPLDASQKERLEAALEMRRAAP